MIPITYALLIAAISPYVLLYGGWSGRATLAVIAMLFSASTAATWWIPQESRYYLAMFAIDLLSLVLKTAIAICSTRRWTIIIAGFQLNAVCAQTAVLVAPAFTTKFHYAMMTIWAVPTLLVLSVGVFLDCRHDQKIRM